MPSTTKRRAPVLEALQRAQRLQGVHSTLHSATIASRLGINAVDLECLDLLLLHGPMAAGQLANAAGLPPNTMTAALDRLERQRFVHRTRSAADRRVVLVDITPTAVSRIAPHYAPIVRQMAQVHRAFTVSELSVVTRYLEAAGQAVAAAVEELRAMESR